MEQRPFRVFLGLVLCFFLHTAANAQYQHIAPSNADLATYGGDSNALVVQVVNLTPYSIVFKEDPIATNLHDEYGPLGSPEMTRTEAKSFMFAPLGVPQRIPPPPSQAFVTALLPDGQPNPAYNKDWNNTETRPYNMVFSWDDHDAAVKQNWVTWTIKGVQCKHDDRCPGGTQDVDLGLWITRDIPHQDTLTAGKYAELVTGVLTKAMGIISVAIEPENPLAWVHFFLTTAELGLSTPEKAEAFNEKQTCDMTQGYMMGCDSNRHGQWWVAGYTLPDPNILGVPNRCYTSGTETSCDPASYKGSDAVEAHWDTLNGGYFTKNIVVTTHLLRGHQATSSYAGRSDCMYPYDQRGKLGSAPVARMTVMTEDQYTAALLASLPLAGRVSTNGAIVGWESGSQFTALVPGQQIIVNDVAYTVQSVNNATSLTLTSSAGLQKDVAWSATQYSPSTTMAVASALAPEKTALAPEKTDKNGVSSGRDLIRSLVRQYGREALVDLLSIVNDLPNAQREFLRELIKSRLAGNPFTPRQEAFVYMIAARLRADLR